MPQAHACPDCGSELPGDAPEGVEPHTVEEDDAWVEGQALIATVEDIELIDP